jgi:hypothetical protein
MCEKHLVNFQAKMPRTSTTGRGGNKRKARDEQGDQAHPSKAGKSKAGGEDTWWQSKCSEKDLLRLVAEGLLQEKSMLDWRPAGKDECSFEFIGVTICFSLFAGWGLALPPSNFFHGLLHFYTLNLFHLNPNSIVHLSIFVHLCEAFLGIQTHFNLSCYFSSETAPRCEHSKLVGPAPS